MATNPNWPTGIYGGGNHEGCACGHVLQMCHKHAAHQYCGGPVPVEDYRAALIRCAELAGVDMSDGLPTWPPVQVWAVRAVEQLRRDYDEGIASATTTAHTPSSPDSGPSRAALLNLVEAARALRAWLDTEGYAYEIGQWDTNPLPAVDAALLALGEHRDGPEQKPETAASASVAAEEGKP